MAIDVIQVTKLRSEPKRLNLLGSQGFGEDNGGARIFTTRLGSQMERRTKRIVSTEKITLLMYAETYITCIYVIYVSDVCKSALYLEFSRYSIICIIFLAFCSFYIDHNSRQTTWVDPRLNPQVNNTIVCFNPSKTEEGNQLLFKIYR